MKYLMLILLFIISFQSKLFAQIDVKSESEILNEVEWLSTNPVEQTNKKFVSKSSDVITFQLVKYPNFPVHFGALKEFMNADKKYKYYDEINIVFISNQLANKIKAGNKYDLQDSSLKSITKVLGYYKLLIEKEPGQKNSVLDKYSKMSKKELGKHINKLVKK